MPESRFKVKFDGLRGSISVTDYKSSHLFHPPPLFLLPLHPLLKNHLILLDHYFFHHWSSFIIHHHHSSSISSIFIINHWHCSSSTTTTASHHAHFVSYHAQRLSTMRTTTFQRVSCLYAPRLMDGQHILGIECLLLLHPSTIFNSHHKPSTSSINMAHQHQDLQSKDLSLLTHLGKFFAHVYFLFTFFSHLAQALQSAVYRLKSLHFHCAFASARAHRQDSTCLRTASTFSKSEFFRSI